MEDVGSDQAGGAIGEEPLTIDGGHGERVEKEGNELKGGGRKKEEEIYAEFAESAEDAEKRGVRLNSWRAGVEVLLVPMGIGTLRMTNRFNYCRARGS